MKKPKAGDIWYAYVAYEDDPTKGKDRPVLILSVKNDKVIAAPITKHAKRKYDNYDLPIAKWQYTSLPLPSTVRIKKTFEMPLEQLDYKKGNMHPEDFINATTKHKKLLYFQNYQHCLASAEYSYNYHKSLLKPPITKNKDIRIAKTLIKQNHNRKEIIKVIAKNSPAAPDLSDKAQVYAVNVVKTAEKYLNPEKIRIKDLQR